MRNLLRVSALAFMLPMITGALADSEQVDTEQTATESVSADQDNAALDECLLTLLKGADDDVSVASIRARCNTYQTSVVGAGGSALLPTNSPVPGDVVDDNAVGESAIEENSVAADVGKTEADDTVLQTRQTDRRIAYSEQTKTNPFALEAYRPNYILPVTYVDGLNTSVYRLDELAPGESVDHFEAQFQISIQFRVAENLFGLGADLGAAYTGRSFWQLYNSDVSSPFRETNHEPELFLTWRNDYPFLGFTHTLSRVGFNHQSNGRSGDLSRSWNRIFAEFGFERGNTVVRFKPWYRIPEDEKESDSDSSGDDNPDIHNFLGYFELLGAHQLGDNTFSALWRNNLRGAGDNKGAIDLSWSYPLNNEFKVYIKYFNGYGYSLIDYDTAVESIGIGLTVNDWL